MIFVLLRLVYILFYFYSEPKNRGFNLYQGTDFDIFVIKS